MSLPESRMINGFRHIRYTAPLIEPEEMIRRSASFYEEATHRRSVRSFSDREVPMQVMENLIRAAGTAPSGANKQPWTFCLIGDKEVKRKIREVAEKEEYESYHNRMPEEWLDDLKKIGTDWHKPFLESAPWLIVAFRRVYETDKAGNKKNNYYVTESIGLACGMLLTAIYHAGLAALTHTPSPMNFLTEILERPDNERPFLLIPVGYPAEETYVPDISRKPLEEICVVY